MEVPVKYRVKIDLSYENEADARALLDGVKGLGAKAVSLNEGGPDEEISFCELELCGHDEGKPCAILERTEVKCR
jgi:hypothetical protein